MQEFYPYFTNDGSPGLYSPKVDDIYHSTHGALTEAYEKFILPANLIEYFEKNNNVKVLDICYGIGYNTKSFLNFYFENIFEKNFTKNKKIFSKKFYNFISYIKSICTDNINAPTNNETVHTDNIFNNKSYKNNSENKIFIKAIDINKNLIYMSPFLKIKGKNKKMLFNNSKINSYLSEKSKNKYKLNKMINKIILIKLIKNTPEILENRDLEEVLHSKKYRDFFEPTMRLFKRVYKTNLYKISTGDIKTAFLHNIYYRYITLRDKNGLKSFINSNIDIIWDFNDARQSLLVDDNVYNFIFLDAFTPSKCPCLWSLEFFKLLYKHLDDNGMILTYSSSAAVRNAFVNAGFCIGYIKNESTGENIGTIAAKNKTLIKHNLSEFDLGLLKTKSGIMYRDKNLDAINEDIIIEHKNAVNKSNLESVTQYKKRCKMEINK